MGRWPIVFPVRIVGVGGGFEYASAGFTHFGVDDVGAMRVQPALTIIAPADHQQASSALRATWGQDGPIYYRLGKDDVGTVPGLDGRFDAARAQVLAEGRDLLVLTMGAIARQAEEAVTQLAAQGHSVGLIIVDTVNPPPIDQLRTALAGVPVAMTVEAHYLVGGLGSLVSEIVAGHGLACRVARCGVATMPVGARKRGLHGRPAWALHRWPGRLSARRCRDSAHHTCRFTTSDLDRSPRSQPGRAHKHDPQRLS
jgi:transketolase